jgi:ATP-dependent Clp protease ATP-binding subunit ClpC
MRSKQIEEHTTSREKTLTSVHLPLSNESKRVLAYAAEEAERLGSKHIGSEHLLLGLLREKGAFAAHLNSQSLHLDRAREIVSKWQKTDRRHMKSWKFTGKSGTWVV